MKFNFYERTMQANECEEYVDFEDWNEAVQHAHDLASEWRNQVIIYEDGKDYSEIVGIPRAKHIELEVNRKVDKLVEESNTRENIATERTKRWT